MKETFERVCNFNGTYRFKCAKDTDGFPTLYDNFPLELCMAPDYKFTLEMHPNGVKSIDYFEGKAMESFLKFNEETVFDFGGGFLKVPHSRMPITLDIVLI